MATWTFKSPSRLEVLLLIQQHNQRYTAPAQQIAVDLTEDEKFRLKVQDKTYSLFPFLEKVLNFNFKDEIVNYDRDGFIAATKNLLQTLEEKKVNDEKAKRAAQRAKTMAEDARGADKLQLAVDQSYREAVKKVEAGRQMLKVSQSPRDISKTNDNFSKTDAKQPRASGKEAKDRKPKISLARAKHNIPLGQLVNGLQHGQGAGQSPKE
ncbi:hypothetical protein BDZ45DRAFT_752635 [Acephala macrosclerotiorum]|nr:hypothetical protein BDZ45DRAFT_752635 [Acephala macrosclerotiorum]